MKFIGDVLSILVGSFLFKLTEILAERYKKQVLSFFLFIMWLIFVILVLLFALLAVFDLKLGVDSVSLTALVFIISSGISICQIWLKIIKWVKLARDEAWLMDFIKDIWISLFPWSIKRYKRSFRLVKNFLFYYINYYSAMVK